MSDWEQAPPALLYKYLRPERLDVLQDCRICFSHRSAFEDDHELQPDYAMFGTGAEIRSFVNSDDKNWPGAVPFDDVIRIIASNQHYQATAIKTARRNMRSPDEFGVLCLTEQPDSQTMWTEYADSGRGFVVGFDTSHAEFTQLTRPGRIGRVCYSDEPFGSFLGTFSDVAATFFRKRMKYEFEREWRSIRALRHLEQRSATVFLSQFDPASVREIIMHKACAVEAELVEICRRDVRYSHVRLTTCGPVCSGGSCLF
jgi:hypothetical protein